MRMNSLPARIDETLLDVRKAYRLLSAYQRMALDAVNFIGNQLGMNYVGGWPLFSNVSPRDGKGKPENWSWDWLNMVLYEFHFTQTLPDSRTLSFSIILISDTGCFTSGNGIDEPVAANFLSPEQSKTKIGFLISADNDWSPPSKATHADMKAFTDGEVPAKYQAQGIVGRCWDFARLASEEETLALVDELITYANRHDIPLQRVEQKA